MSIKSMLPKQRFTKADGTRVERLLNKADLMWVALLRDTTIDVQSSGGIINIGENRLLYSEFEALCEQVDGDVALLLARAIELGSVRPKQING